MNAYPFYEIDGKEVHEVAVGPIHAGVIEPGSFRFMCLGEQVHHLEIHLGYQHRGVEALLLAARSARARAAGRDHRRRHERRARLGLLRGDRGARRAARSSPRSSVARGVALELERIAMHLAGLAGLAADIGFLQGATTYGRLRTTAINTIDAPVRQPLRPRRAASRRQSACTLDAELADAGAREPRAARARTSRSSTTASSTRATVQHRFRGRRRASRERRRSELGLVGMAARASGVADRSAAPRAAGVYDALPDRAVRRATSGDCWARALLRIARDRRSLAWIGAVARAPSARGSTRAAPLGALAPAQLVDRGRRGLARRGRPLPRDRRRRARSSTTRCRTRRCATGSGSRSRCASNEISDFPICNKSFDLSYCGNDL